MKIEKVLNNNVVVALDENGAETVLMGRGLGFGRRAGDEAPPDKAAFIALHFVNAQLGGEIRDIYDMTYLLQAVFRIVYDEYGFRPDDESLNYYRFVTHLKFYARRIVSGEGYGDEDSDLLDVVRFKYPKAYACADKIRVYVQREKNFHSGQNELLYLTIHIARVMEHIDDKK